VAVAAEAANRPSESNAHQSASCKRENLGLIAQLSQRRPAGANALRRRWQTWMQTADWIDMKRTLGLAIAGLTLVLVAGCVVETRPVVVAPRPVPPPPPGSFQIQVLQQRAAQGNAAAQFTLGSCYANGRGVPRNYAEAVKWYYASASRGYAAAQYRLGVCYVAGLGVPRNDVTAVAWYRKAAAQAYPAAEDSLGVCYYTGRGVAQNYPAGERWCRLAAAQGYPLAQTHLASFAKQPPVAGVPGARPMPAPAPATATAQPAESAGGTPLTVDEIKEQTNAGIKADSIIDWIKSTNSRFSPQDIAAAQQAHVDPAVIECMQANRR
jgi:hypothetical protein